jgi:hypothetical protein
LSLQCKKVLFINKNPKFIAPAFVQGKTIENEFTSTQPSAVNISTTTTGFLSTRARHFFRHYK